jgi:hypothetical protein
LRIDLVTRARWLPTHLNHATSWKGALPFLGSPKQEDAMDRLTRLLLAGVLGVGFGARAQAHENEGGHAHQSVTMAEVPAAVQATLKREANGGKVEELRKETRKDGSVIYEAEIVKNGKGSEIEVSATGKVLERGKAHDESSEHEKK